MRPLLVNTISVLALLAFGSMLALAALSDAPDGHAQRRVLDDVAALLTGR